MKYYIDTCIWIDYFENRCDRFRPLGEWALMLINKVIKEENFIVYSDLVYAELLEKYDTEIIRRIISIVPQKSMAVILSNIEQTEEAKQLSRTLKIPRKDALHSIMARDCGAILVSRDAHFLAIKGIVVKKPEELI